MSSGHFPRDRDRHSQKPAKPRREALRLPLANEHLQQRALSLNLDEPLPTIEVKAPVNHPVLYRKRLGEFDRNAQHGDLVKLVLPEGETYGYGLFNIRAEATIRVLQRGGDPPGEAWWKEKLAAAVALRERWMTQLKETNAWRVVHAEADGLPGIVIDRYDHVLSLETFSLGMFQRAEAIATLLGPMCGTTSWIVRCGPNTEEQEGYVSPPFGAEHAPGRVTVQEFGTKFQVDLQQGHKTGFFCDQRENRQKLAQFCAGKSVLDLCCYTGGFSLQAKRLGGAEEVIGVDLDEVALEQAKKNAKLNQIQARFTQSDAFSYLRDAIRTQRQWDVVVLDPPKLIRGRDEFEEGRNKYFDLNRLAAQVVKPGGLLLTCSCSGLISPDEFLKTICLSMPRDRSARVLFRSGAAIDHPVATNCLEGEYLKAVWLMVD